MRAALVGVLPWLGCCPGWGAALRRPGCKEWMNRISLCEEETAEGWKGDREGPEGLSFWLYKSPCHHYLLVSREKGAASLSEPPWPLAKILCLFYWPVLERATQNTQPSPIQRKVQLGPMFPCCHEVCKAGKWGWPAFPSQSLQASGWVCQGDLSQCHLVRPLDGR